MKRVLTLTALAALVLTFLAGCAATDVVLKYSPGSFQSIVEKYPKLVTDAGQYYNFTVDGETTLKISRDYSGSGENDIMIETPLRPFADAGLDASKLGEGYLVADDMLCLTADYGSGTGEKNTITDALFESVTANRRALSYHQSMDHYGIALTAGKFEWAKDISKNDKDIVFVIRAQPLKDRGVDVTQIEGWTLATVEDNDGSKVEVLLKAYNLDNP